MTLLDTVAAAAAASDSGELSPPLSRCPLILNPGEVLLEPNPNPNPNIQFPLIDQASNWSLSDLDINLTDLIADFTRNLSEKLRNPKKPFSDRGAFISLLNSFFKKISFKIGTPIQSQPNPMDPLDINYTLAAVEKLGFVVVPEVSALVAEGCVHFDFWEVLEALLAHNLIKDSNSYNLVENLAEKNQAVLLCSCVAQIPDLRCSEIYAFLKFCLSPSKDSCKGMVRVRNECVREALLAVHMALRKENAPEKGTHLSRGASLLLVIALDKFHPSEICLHYMFARNIDGLVFSSAVSRLDGYEVLSLVRYFVKWLERYKRFPEAMPLYKGGDLSGLMPCKSIPNSESVMTGLELVLNEHFSFLVSNPEIRDELETVGRVVGTLVSEADLCLPFKEIIKHLKPEAIESMEVDSFLQEIAQADEKCETDHPSSALPPDTDIDAKQASRDS